MMCLCGCNQEATCVNGYVIGHWNKGTFRGEETKKRISNALIGHTSCNKGIPMSEEQKKKISVAQKGIPRPYQSGINHPMYGKHWSKEIREKMGKAKRGKPSPIKGIPKTEEQKKKISIAMKGKPSAMKGKKTGKPAWNRGISPSMEQRKNQSKLMQGRKLSEKTKQKIGNAVRGSKNGFYNKKHTKDSRQKMSKSLVGKFAGRNNPSYGKPRYHAKRYDYASPLQGQVCFRSAWELVYAQYLDSIREPWLYELETFELLGEETYTPDFYLPRQEKFIEIKGWLENKAKNKIKKFKEEYPFDLDILFKSDLKGLGVI